MPRPGHKGGYTVDSRTSRTQANHTGDFMAKQLRTAARLALLAIASSACAAAQATCDKCAATYVPASEIEAYFNLAKTASTTNIRMRDQQVRAVNAGRTQLGIGIVYRTKLLQPVDNSVAEHHQVSEVYHVLDGEATLVTGSD